ncbi:MAG: hypothetical protein AAFM91_04065 [Pseudomonadota bacterium]
MTDHAPRLPLDDLSFSVLVDGPLDGPIAAFAAAAVRASAIDPVLTEVIRLRCAQYHDCRLCGSLRVQDALDAGFDESMQRKIGAHEQSDLAPEVKAALRLCDAMLMHPNDISAELRDEVRKYFNDAQIIEICVDVMKWSQQKALVALRVEPPVSSEHLTQLHFDDDGNPSVGEPIAGAA